MTNSFLEFVRTIAEQQSHQKHQKELVAAEARRNNARNLNVTKNVDENDVTDQQLSKTSGQGDVDQRRLSFYTKRLLVESKF